MIKGVIYDGHRDHEEIQPCEKGFLPWGFPAATWVQVSRLYEPDSKLKVELIEQLPGNE